MNSTQGSGPARGAASALGACVDAARGAGRLDDRGDEGGRSPGQHAEPLGVAATDDPRRGFRTARVAAHQAICRQRVVRLVVAALENDKAAEEAELAWYVENAIELSQEASQELVAIYVYELAQLASALSGTSQEAKLRQARRLRLSFSLPGRSPRAERKGGRRAMRGAR